MEYDRRKYGLRSQTSVKTLNEAFSTRATRRRYEVWFLRLGLANGEGAWWLRYLLMNPGSDGCLKASHGMPVQVWATWFPRGEAPLSFIQGFPLSELRLSAKGQSPFSLSVGENEIEEDSCRGRLQVDGHTIQWNLSYRSKFRATLSSKGWIGFSRTPHSDAIFSGRITLDGRSFEGDPLGFGVQGHNCGYRHRHFWNWTHTYFDQPGGNSSTLEALVYEMPFGLVYRKAILWHEGVEHVFRNLKDLPRTPESFAWNFRASTKEGLSLEAAIDGSGPSLHRLTYLRTNCKGAFEVRNNSLSSATLRIAQRGNTVASLHTSSGAVLEMV